jgi:cellulose synthase/poly-beta-1,6-N-acetylglucosamine synthase-like glycosyltransferase
MEISREQGHNAGYETGSRLPTVDVIIPVYNERGEALSGTLLACLKQSYPVASIYVVDDGSLVPVSLPDWANPTCKITLLRLPENRGISAARNAAIASATAPLLACVNAEVLPDPDWVATCADYLARYPKVGACYTRTVPENTRGLLTRWRMRFQEPKFEKQTGPAPFAHGHAVFFRKAAVDAVGGYDVRFRLTYEDADISRRLWKLGWEVHFIEHSRCVSIQKDTLRSLAVKQLRDSGWTSPAESSLAHLYVDLTKWTAIRAGRNLVKGRLSFLPVDVALWAYALWIATGRTVDNYFARR